MAMIMARAVATKAAFAQGGKGGVFVKAPMRGPASESVSDGPAPGFLPDLGFRTDDMPMSLLPSSTAAAVEKHGGGRFAPALSGPRL